MVSKTIKNLCVAIALSVQLHQLHGDATLSTSKGFIQPRPSSGNIAREMMMESNYRHTDSGSWFGEFSATGFYQRYWTQGDQENGLGAFPFWSGSNTMTIGNNEQVSTTTPSTLANVDAYQFGLGQVTPGANPATINLNPIFYQAGTDFMLIMGQSGVKSGFYAKAKVPLAITEVTYQLTENNPLVATDYPAGALSVSNATVNEPATSMSQAFLGFKNEQFAGNGDYTPMLFGLINNISTTVIRFADFELTAGYNWIFHENSSVTIAGRMSCPSGNKADGTYMIEPIVGRGGNYGLGGYAAGNFQLWHGAHNNKLTCKFMADVLHLFTTETTRSYDLVSAGPGSRYLLVANYANGSYQNEIQNLINHTTLLSNSTFAAEVDIALALNYSCGHGWSFDLGYEFYGRSAETLEITGNFANQTYAILGRQGVGQIGAGATPTTLAQPTATISSSVARQDVVGVPSALVVDATIASNRIAASDLDVAAAAQAAYLTSKAFTKIAYEWNNINYIPFFGMIAEWEFSTCLNNALPQWSIAIVGGTSF
ncbi:hypothetical protein [Candidatus Chromulinivorax destructor]|uniref:Uncharacterized protein n=1 Tax=Candidatus Chromulinivorax destructor TaxID=2066483 RepID=A0A345ZAH7_9BACT|nr:hypothetical protein [Candidatus Chromulinivorax destructor]AXK60294.1 hypothetical protein C0J27_00820 [Candidatus Chromulinivorax destructor]